MNSLEFPVLHDNTFYSYILHVMFLSVFKTISSEVHQFCEFYLLMEPLLIYDCSYNLFIFNIFVFDETKRQKY